MVLLIVALACGTRAPGMAGCASLPEGKEREECHFTEAKALVPNPDALDAALAPLDPLARDLLLVRLAMDTPDQSAVLCGRVMSPVAKQRCEQILGRPHLRGPAP